LESPINGWEPAEWDKPGSDRQHRSVVGGRFGGVGLVLTIVYVFLTIISPEQFGEEWANYHLLTILGGVILLISLPGIFAYKRIGSSIQTFLLLGFIVAIGISEVANGWVGGIIVSWGLFLPSVVVFLFIVANVTTTRGLKILILAIVASCLVVVVEALCGYYFGFRGETFILSQTLFSEGLVVGEFVRIRGASFLSDPNDFAQILLIALPLTSIAWRRGRFVTNSLFVFAPVVLLLWAIFLTHSRGALIGLAILALIITRGRMSTAASGIITILLILGLLAVNFTGGRMISADAGADRLSLWASGLQMFKSAPFFGVGFGKFADFEDLTAHNSFVLCLAELGLVGSTLWVALLVATMLGLNRIIRVQEKWQADLASAAKVAREQQAAFSDLLVPSFGMHAATLNATSSAVSVQSRIGHAPLSSVPTRWIVAVRLALISFITTGWFLSRTYQATLYLVLGLATATIAMHRCGDEPHGRIRWVSYTLAVEAVAIVFIYEIVRLRF